MEDNEYWCSLKKGYTNCLSNNIQKITQSNDSIFSFESYTTILENIEEEILSPVFWDILLTPALPSIQVWSIDDVSDLLKNNNAHLIEDLGFLQSIIYLDFIIDIIAVYQNTLILVRSVKKSVILGGVYYFPSGALPHLIELFIDKTLYEDDYLDAALILKKIKDEFLDHSIRLTEKVYPKTIDWNRYIPYLNRIVVPAFLFKKLEKYRFIEKILNEKKKIFYKNFRNINKSTLPSYKEVDNIYRLIYRLFTVKPAGIRKYNSDHRVLFKHSAYIFQRFYATYLLLEKGVFKLWNNLLSERPELTPLERAYIIANKVGLKVDTLIRDITKSLLTGEETPRFYKDYSEVKLILGREYHKNRMKQKHENLL